MWTVLLKSLAWLALIPTCMAHCFLIRHARVFDGEQMLGVRDVLVASGKIVDIAPTISPPPGAVLIEATGLILLPGLFDSHAHIGDGGYILRCAALFGVTTVIDLGTVGAGNTPHEIHERVRTAAPGESADFLSEVCTSQRRAAMGQSLERQCLLWVTRAMLNPSWTPASLNGPT